MPRYLGAAQALAGALILLTPYILFPVCTKQVETKAGGFLPMKCHWTAQAELGIGALILLGGMILLISKRAETQRFLSMLTAGLGIAAISLPTWLIGMCASAAMDCRVGTLPALVILGGASLVISGLAFIMAKEEGLEAYEPLRAPSLS